MKLRNFKFFEKKEITQFLPMRYGFGWQSGLNQFIQLFNQRL